MNRSSQEKSAETRSPLQQQIASEVELGIRLSADLINANLPDLAIRITTISSPWFARTCQVCRDRFREGDQVRLCPLCGEAFHDDRQYFLQCWQKKFANGSICKEGGPDHFNEHGADLPRCEFVWQPSSDKQAWYPSAEDAPSSVSSAELLVGQFVQGIKTTWRPFGEQQSIKVEKGSPAVRHNCPWCRFRIRVGDWVVACPCQSNCGTYFHQDVFRRRTCWNEWNGVEGNTYCPTTGAAYPEDMEDSRA